MTNPNPVRQILNTLADEFKYLNINCLHFNVELNALIEERTDVENKKIRRRLCQCLRCVDALKPETSTFYKDKSAYIMGMIHHVAAHYDDLKRRYLWALERLADMTIKLNYLTEEQYMREAKGRQLGDSWKDFYRNKGEKFNFLFRRSASADADIVLGKRNGGHRNRPLRADERFTSSFMEQKRYSPSFQSKGIENVDNFLGMMHLMSENREAKNQKRRKSSGRIYTKITRSPKLTTIEDIPEIDKRESGDPIKNTRISKVMQKLRKSKKENQELAVASEIRMQIYTLMAEVAERDELINSLTAQMKIKDIQITQLLNVIHKEKLNTQKPNFSSCSEISSKEHNTIIFKE